MCNNCNILVNIFNEAKESYQYKQKLLQKKLKAGIVKGVSIESGLGNETKKQDIHGNLSLATKQITKTSKDIVAVSSSSKVIHRSPLATDSIKPCVIDLKEKSPQQVLDETIIENERIQGKGMQDKIKISSNAAKIYRKGKSFSSHKERELSSDAEPGNSFITIDEIQDQTENIVSNSKNVSKSREHFQNSKQLRKITEKSSYKDRDQSSPHSKSEESLLYGGTETNKEEEEIIEDNERQRRTEHIISHTKNASQAREYQSLSDEENQKSSSSKSEESFVFRDIKEIDVKALKRPSQDLRVENKSAEEDEEKIDCQIEQTTDNKKKRKRIIRTASSCEGNRATSDTEPVEVELSMKSYSTFNPKGNGHNTVIERLLREKEHTAQNEIGVEPTKHIVLLDMTHPNYNCVYVCRYCNTRLKDKQSISDHILTHETLIEKRRNLTPCYSSVKLKKIDGVPISIDNCTVVVINSVKLLRGDENPDHYTLYTPRRLHNPALTSNSKKQYTCEDVASGDDDVVDRSRLRKSIRLVSSVFDDLEMIPDSDAATSINKDDSNGSSAHSGDKSLIVTNQMSSQEITESKSRIMYRNELILRNTYIKPKDRSITNMNGDKSEKLPKKAGIITTYERPITIENHNLIKRIIIDTMYRKKQKEDRENTFDKRKSKEYYGVRRMLISSVKGTAYNAQYNSANLLKLLKRKGLKIDWLNPERVNGKYHPPSSTFSYVKIKTMPMENSIMNHFLDFIPCHEYRDKENSHISVTDSATRQNAKNVNISTSAHSSPVKTTSSSIVTRTATMSAPETDDFVVASIDTIVKKSNTDGNSDSENNVYVIQEDLSNVKITELIVTSTQQATEKENASDMIQDCNPTPGQTAANEDVVCLDSDSEDDKPPLSTTHFTNTIPTTTVISTSSNRTATIVHNAVCEPLNKRTGYGVPKKIIRSQVPKTIILPFTHLTSNHPPQSASSLPPQNGSIKAPEKLSNQPPQNSSNLSTRYVRSRQNPSVLQLQKTLVQPPQKSLVQPSQKSITQYPINLPSQDEFVLSPQSSSENAFVQSPQNPLLQSSQKSFIQPTRNSTIFSTQNASVQCSKNSFILPPQNPLILLPQHLAVQPPRKSLTQPTQNPTNFLSQDELFHSPQNFILPPQNSLIQLSQDQLVQLPQNSFIQSIQISSGLPYQNEFVQSPQNSSRHQTQYSSNFTAQNTYVHSPQNSYILLPQNTMLQTPQNSMSEPKENSSNLPSQNAFVQPPQNSSSMSSQNLFLLSTQNPSLHAPHQSSSLPTQNTIQSPQNPSIHQPQKPPVHLPQSSPLQNKSKKNKYFMQTYAKSNKSLIDRINPTKLLLQNATNIIPQRSEYNHTHSGDIPLKQKPFAKSVEKVSTDHALLNYGQSLGRPKRPPDQTYCIHDNHAKHQTNATPPVSQNSTNANLRRSKNEHKYSADIPLKQRLLAKLEQKVSTVHAITSDGQPGDRRSLGSPDALTTRPFEYLDRLIRRHGLELTASNDDKFSTLTTFDIKLKMRRRPSVVITLCLKLEVRINRFRIKAVQMKNNKELDPWQMAAHWQRLIMRMLRSKTESIIDQSKQLESKADANVDHKCVCQFTELLEFIYGGNGRLDTAITISD